MTTDNTQELDEILERYRLKANMAYSEVDDGFHTAEEFKGLALPKTLAEARQAILDWHNKQVVRAELDILNHLLRADKHGIEPSAHLIRLRAIQMQGSAEKRLSKGKLRRAA